MKVCKGTKSVPIPDPSKKVKEVALNNYQACFGKSRNYAQPSTVTEEAESFRNSSGLYSIGPKFMNAENQVSFCEPVTPNYFTNI